jgi:ribonucleoside-diphosphate reductase alpha chain
MARKARGTRFNLDPAHERLNIYDETSPDNVLTMDIWRSKYRHGDESHPFDSFRRVVEGVYAKDPDKEAKAAALEAMQKGLWIPAGRIQAGAGTPNIVTLLNCYMCQDIHDSMSGIADALRDAMLTMQQGGGIGMNFSTLRPTGAYLRRTGAVASGPLPFMDMWDSMCQTIMSAGSRRGAMMAVMDCEHPDLPTFIQAKREAGRLTNFNVSVLVSDAFMQAVEDDEDWFLGFDVPRADGKHLFVTEREDRGHLEQWYAYSSWKARDLWDLILENTYEWSEPGVIFMDRVNRCNNLQYCETITGTNPCGEQPLPPNGCCNLGAINLARMISKPFTEQAKLDWHLLGEITKLGTRFLDNVIDTTLYPLDSQAEEEYAKRRIGIGITGLANCMAQLGLTYGSAEAVDLTDQIMSAIKNITYKASAKLAQERGPFPLYSHHDWGKSSPIVQGLDDSTKKVIGQHGMRNGVLLTIAPTGTTSILAGNVSSGLEPVFLNKVQRNVRQEDGSTKPYTAFDYGYLLYCKLKGVNPETSHKLPDQMITHEELKPLQHLTVQEVCQRHIDASVSKTINCPQAITYEAFKDIYTEAYKRGLKGCTTYRYSDVRGAVLSKGGTDAASEAGKLDQHPLKRPEALHGTTYKVKWPNVDENYYITINQIADKPFEVFIQSTSSKYADWTTALALMVSAIMRKGGDISFISQELSKVRSAEDSAWINGKYYGSLVALIGDTLGKHLLDGDIQRVENKSLEVSDNPQIHLEIQSSSIKGDTCPKCNAPALISQEGCDKCLNCDYSNCG